MLDGVADKPVGASGTVAAPSPLISKSSKVVAAPECAVKKKPLLLKVPPVKFTAAVPLPFKYKLAPVVAPIVILTLKGTPTVQLNPVEVFSALALAFCLEK